MLAAEHRSWVYLNVKERSWTEPQQSHALGLALETDGEELEPIEAPGDNPREHGLLDGCLAVRARFKEVDVPGHSRGPPQRPQPEDLCNEAVAVAGYHGGREREVDPEDAQEARDEVHRRGLRGVRGPETQAGARLSAPREHQVRSGHRNVPRISRRHVGGRQLHHPGRQPLLACPPPAPHRTLAGPQASVKGRG